MITSIPISCLFFGGSRAALASLTVPCEPIQINGTMSHFLVYFSISYFGLSFCYIDRKASKKTGIRGYFSDSFTP
jgi:hypothetical protein